MFDRVVGPEGLLSNTTLWQVGLVVCEKLEEDYKYLESVQLLKIMLSPASSPESIWREPLVPGDSQNLFWQQPEEPHNLGIIDPVSLLARLKSQSACATGASKHTQLVTEIERLTKSKKENVLLDNERLSNSQKKGKKTHRSRKTKKKAAA